jgi:protein-S-isoprenylcysteine O-methyltransferase Ste14
MPVKSVTKAGANSLKPPASGIPLRVAVSAAFCSHYSQRSRALIFRLCASLWFLGLAVPPLKVAKTLFEDIAAGWNSPVAWPVLLSQICIVLFYSIIAAIMLLRPEPAAKSEGLGPPSLALAGTYGSWLIPLLPPGPEYPALALASAALLLLCELLMIYILVLLGRSFSLLPQARKLVTRGPYAIVRHPLYLVEEMALASILLLYAWFAALPFLVLHFGVQIRRIQLEEKILTKTFPGYALYVQRTPCLLPGVW